jgi:3-oxocholest-4-en-26-oate---CoA ligase
LICANSFSARSILTAETTTRWVIADVWETIARLRPDSAGIAFGPRHLSWSQFDDQANGFAQRLLQDGLTRQAKVAFVLTNCPEFLVGVFACLKAGLVPINTNFRYTAREAADIWNTIDAEVVVFSAGTSETVELAKPLSPRVRHWYWVGDIDDGCPPWASPFPAPTGIQTRAPWGRSPDDLVVLLTGGTTGRPKGVMWRQDDVFAILNATGTIRYPAKEGLDAVARLQSDDGRYRPRLLPCGPLIHGTAAFSAYGVLNAGGSVVLLENPHFDADHVLDVIDAEHVTHLSVIGEAHARPLVARLESDPQRWSLSSLRLITSAGTALSAASRSALLRFCPNAVCVDLLASSEAPSLGRASSTRSDGMAPGVFRPGPNVRVVDEEGHDVVPGSGEVGVIVSRGRGPLGYYNDPTASAQLFRIIDGERWVASGDLASVDADGALRLRGRAASVINTGGEKVFAGEVEEALLAHPDVVDAAVLGLPHRVLGQIVAAVVQSTPGRTIDPDDIRRQLRTTLAGYKIPKEIHVVDSLGRGANGKIDLGALTRRVAGTASAGGA